MGWGFLSTCVPTGGGSGLRDLAVNRFAAKVTKVQ